METVRVSLGERSYDIFIGSGILGRIGSTMKTLSAGGTAPSMVALVSNPTVHGLYGETVTASLKGAGLGTVEIIIPDGEEYKSLLWAEYIWGELLKARLDRQSIIVALGGGVIGDIAGFAASTYMRGIRYVQAPTTLLAQVDSSVGGKTGVNHPLGKNMIGAFHQPSLVWIDTSALKSLPRREFISGMAEVIKYGVIWDSGLFEYLKHNRDKILGLDDGALTHIVMRSCSIKAEVVSRDERESGLRAILNFGHTIGHAIETATGYTRYLHGEAVAMGMAIEARLGTISAEEASRIKGVIDAYGLPSLLPDDIDISSVMEAMEVDKKALGGELRFVLPLQIGKVRVQAVERERVRRLLKG